MNYSNHDCRLRAAGSKLSRLFRRKPARKNLRSEKAENRALAALRAVTQIGVAVFALAMAAEAQIVIRPTTEAASKDTVVYEHVPSPEPFPGMYVYSPTSGAHFASLLQFDLSTITIPASLITNVKLTLYSASANDATPGNVTLSPMTTAWRENAAEAGTAPLATYSTIFGATPTLSFGTVASSTLVTGTGFFQWDVTDLVKSWVSGATPNYGVIIQIPPGSSAGYEFADAVDKPAIADSSPSLTVVPEPSSLALALAGAGAFLARRRRFAQPPAL